MAKCVNDLTNPAGRPNLVLVVELFLVVGLIVGLIVGTTVTLTLAKEPIYEQRYSTRGNL